MLVADTLLCTTKQPLSTEIQDRKEEEKKGAVIGEAVLGLSVTYSGL